MKSKISVISLKQVLTYTVGLGALLAMGAGLPAVAQEEDAAPVATPAAEAEARQQTVTITGSRIPTDPNLTGSTPVQ